MKKLLFAVLLTAGCSVMAADKVQANTDDYFRLDNPEADQRLGMLIRYYASKKGLTPQEKMRAISGRDVVKTQVKVEARELYNEHCSSSTFASILSYFVPSWRQTKEQCDACDFWKRLASNDSDGERDLTLFNAFHFVRGVVVGRELGFYQIASNTWNNVDKQELEHILNPKLLSTLFEEKSEQ